MKIALLFSFAFLFSIVSAFGQKAGKGAAPKPDEYYSCPMHPQITSHEAGTCSICGRQLTLSPKEKRAAAMVKDYSCPVHHDVVQHDPGKCPKCGRKMKQMRKMKGEN